MKPLIKHLIQKGWVFSPNPSFSTDFCYELKKGYNEVYLYTYPLLEQDRDSVSFYAIVRDTHDGPFTEHETVFDCGLEHCLDDVISTVDDYTKLITDRPLVIDLRSTNEVLRNNPNCISNTSNQS